MPLAKLITFERLESGVAGLFSLFQIGDARAVEVLDQLFGFDLTTVLDPASIDRFKHTLEERHPITNNLRIVDRKYLEKVRTGVAEGRDVNLDEQEVLSALDTVLLLVRGVHSGLYPPTATG